MTDLERDDPRSISRDPADERAGRILEFHARDLRVDPADRANEPAVWGELESPLAWGPLDAA